ASLAMGVSGTGARHASLITPLLLWRNHRQQQVGWLVAAGVQRGLGAGVVVGMKVGEVLRAYAVCGRNIEPQLVALPEDHRRCPDFDLAFHHFSGLEPQALVVGVV